MTSRKGSAPKKRPSGAEYKRRRQARAAEERARREAAGQTVPAINPLPPLGDAILVHVRVVEALYERLRFTATDPGLEETQRSKIMAELSRTIGLLSQKAELEHAFEQAKVEINAHRDELLRVRTELEQERAWYVERARELGIEPKTYTPPEHHRRSKRP